MAIISTYANDTTVSGADRLIGTDSVTNQVRNFLMSDVIDFGALDYVTEVVNTEDVGTYVANAIIGGSGLRLVDATGIQVGDFHIFNGTTFTVTGFPGITNVITVSPNPSFSEVGPDLLFRRFSGGGTVTITGDLNIIGDVTGITGLLPDFVTVEDSFTIGSYTFSSAETFGATTMSLTTTVGLQIGDQFVNNNTTHTITEVQTNFVRVTPGVSSFVGIPTGAVFDWTRPRDSLLFTDSSLMLTEGEDTLVIRADTVLARSDTIDNQNAADIDEPATFKLWSGNRAEYDALTPAADTMYNITDDVMFVDTVGNQNSTGLAIKIWTGTLVEYTALTPSSDTLYNVTDE